MSNNLRQAAQQALEALEILDGVMRRSQRTDAAIAALRQALAEPEQERPHPDYPCRSDGRCQYAIDSGAEGLGHCPPGKCCMAATLEPTTQEIQNTAENLALMKRMFPQPEQKPVAWLTPTGALYRTEDVDGCFDDRDTPLYTAPAPRKPLTDEEINHICKSFRLGYTDQDLARAIERAHGIGEQHE